MRRLLSLLPLAMGCHLDALLRAPADPPKCMVNVYIYKVDPQTGVRFDSSWAGSMEVACPKS